MRVLHHPFADHRKKAGEPQVGYHDHHAEQQHDGVVVDGRVRLGGSQGAGGKHERGANDGRARAVHPEEREASDSEDEVSGGEDQDRGEQDLIVTLSVRVKPSAEVGRRATRLAIRREAAHCARGQP